MQDVKKTHLPLLAFTFVMRQHVYVNFNTVVLQADHIQEGGVTFSVHNQPFHMVGFRDLTLTLFSQLAIFLVASTLASL